MTLTLRAGEEVRIEFEDTDGRITVGFVTDPGRWACRDADSPEGLPTGIVVHADMADSSGRAGLIYHEPFGTGREMLGEGR